MPSSLENFFHQNGNFPVFLAQNPLVHLDDGHARAEPGERLTEFHTDCARAEDEQTRGQFFQAEKLLRW